MEFATIRGEPVYIYASALHTQLWIVMPFVNVTKRLGTKIVSSIRSSRDVSRVSHPVSLAILYSFVEEEWSVKKICADGGRSDMLPLGLRSDSLCKVYHKLESTPCVADCVLVASRNVLFESSLI